jgi:uncharacterized protein (TIGR02453 family)
MIQSSTIRFLKDLKRNNNKQWFDAHREMYLAARSDFENFVKQVLTETASFDKELKELEVKNCTFRINRDVRFSKDKSPYKTNMGAYLNKGGKKSIYAGYYFHLEPGGNSFTGGGLWMPESLSLKKIRQEIDYGFPEFKKIISGSAFKKQYQSGLTMNADQMLVNVPKGYDKENNAAEFLKLKNFVALKKIPDSQLTGSVLKKEVILAFKALMPLVKFLNHSLE